MKIDGRLKKQGVNNLYGLNRVYVWKEQNKTYKVGINGTAHHYGNLTKDEAESIVNSLVFAKK